MMKLMNIYKAFDIIVVPFPFVDSVDTKNRPAVVLSSLKYFNIPSGHTVCAMITSSQHTLWPHDTVLTDLKSAGLVKDSVIRLKIFTIDNRLIRDVIGKLSRVDREALQQNFVITHRDLMGNAQ